MSTMIVAQPDVAAPVLNDIEYAYHVVVGKELWRAGKPIAACINDAQREGWYEAEAKGHDAFLRCLLEEAESGVDVDWDAAGNIYW